jgi:hypothetical protein
MTRISLVRLLPQVLQPVRQRSPEEVEDEGTIRIWLICFSTFNTSQSLPRVNDMGSEAQHVRISL